MKTTVKREKLNATPNSDASRDFLRKSAKAVCPPDHTWQGTAVVHFFEHVDPLDRSNVTYAFITHATGMEGMPEKQCDAGVKELARMLMSRYGRTPPETRKENPLRMVEG